ncbi:integration host factor, actinobacterial type [Streptomyces sp. NPDC087908]|uniref:integration host factor, actinobacterial type n=1 Tax=Streptomyces sp. NPDC087908 TaxID=3365820 RepID=UPI0037F943CA
MPLIEMTNEARLDALHKAIALRRERAEILAALRRGSLSVEEALRDRDSAIGRVYVRQLLRSMPDIGEVRSRTILQELRISEGRRVQGLGVRQRQRLIAYFAAN